MAAKFYLMFTLGSCIFVILLESIALAKDPVFADHLHMKGHGWNATSETRGRRASDGQIERQYGFDASYMMPQLILGIIIPIAILIGIGIILLKLFIIGIWIFGRR